MRSGSLRYLNQEDVRDIRNMDKIMSDYMVEGGDKKWAQHMSAPIGRDMRNDLWLFFRRLRVRLDRAGDKTRPFQATKREGRTRKG